MIKSKKITGIKSWPLDDRPREKLLKKGAGTLSNSELLAILLRTGTHGTSAIDLARNILKKFGTFRNMAHTDTHDWKEFKGLGGAKIAHIQAALEIGRRYQQDGVSPGKQKIASAKDIVDLVLPHMRDLKTEVFKVVYLDNNNRIIDISDVAIGTVDYVFPTPSREDTSFTKELHQAGKFMQIDVADHLIIGSNRFYSFADALPTLTPLPLSQREGKRGEGGRTKQCPHPRYCFVYRCPQNFRAS